MYIYRIHREQLYSLLAQKKYKKDEIINLDGTNSDKNILINYY